MGQKGTGRRLSDQERMEIIARLEGEKPHASAAECARQYGVSSAAITKLMKMKDKIKQRFRENNAFSQQRKRGATDRHAAFEDELFQWISMQQQEMEQHSSNTTSTETPPIGKPDAMLRRNPSGMVLTAARVQEKAQELLKEHTLGNFRASKGWFYRFCRRYGLSRSTLMPLEGSIDEGDDGIDGSGSEIDDPVTGAVEEGLQGAVGTEQGSTEELKTEGGTEKSKKTKLKTSTDANGSKKGSKNGSGKSTYWLGIQSLQDTLAKAAMALDHPEGREYLGDDAASEMLRSIQQSMGVVECIRQKKKSAHGVSVPGALGVTIPGTTGATGASGVSETIGSNGGILEDVVV